MINIHPLMQLQLGLGMAVATAETWTGQDKPIDATYQFLVNTIIEDLHRQLELIQGNKQVGSLMSRADYLKTAYAFLKLAEKRIRAQADAYDIILEVPDETL